MTSRACELALGATATDHAPWHIVPSDSKTRRTLMVAQILLHELEQLAPAYPPGPAPLIGRRVEWSNGPRNEWRFGVRLT